MSSTIDRRGGADPLEELVGAGRDADEAPDLVENGRHRPGRVPFLSVPTSLRSLELGVSPTAVRGILLLVVVAALVLAGRWAWVTRWSDPLPQSRVESIQTSGPEGGAEGSTTGSGEGPQTPVPEGQAQEAEAGATGSPDAPGAAGQAAPAERVTHVVVHVTGQVGTPGVVTLPQGSRVVDAVEAAGGLTTVADQASLNLARQLTDGEQLWVGRPGEEPPPGLARPGPSTGGGAAGAGSGGTGTGSDAGGGAVLVVDLNTATEAELDELPGVGPVTAGRILAWRDEHGRFSVPEELLEVSGIGERTLEQLRPHVTVGG